MVRYREFWGAGKWREVRDSLDAEEAEFEASYAVLGADKANRFTLRPGGSAEDYPLWASARDLGSGPIKSLAATRAAVILEEAEVPPCPTCSC